MDTQRRNNEALHPGLAGPQTDVGPVEVEATQRGIERKPRLSSKDEYHLVDRIGSHRIPERFAVHTSETGGIEVAPEAAGDIDTANT